MRKLICVARCATAATVAALALLVAGPAGSTPVPSSTALVKSAVASVAVDARWYGWRGRRYFIGRSYGSRRYGSGCHVPGGYNRPNGCW
jgi:hypothetical protein